MDNRSNTKSNKHEPVLPGRREVLMAGAGLIATPLLSGFAAGADAEQKDAPTQKGPFPTRAYGATKADAPLGPLRIERRAVGPRDVLLDILYCGICPSDIHAVRGDWRQPNFPIVPGHEIVGRVRAVGAEVTKFKVGDIGGVGCMVNSCGTCENCRADREQNCLTGTTFTYDSEDRAHGGYTFGGYPDKVVVASTSSFASRRARTSRRRPRSFARASRRSPRCSTGSSGRARRSASSASAGWGTWRSSWRRRGTRT